MAQDTIPDALLLIASGCPHCPTVLTGLTELVKHGLIGRLEVVNVGIHPERASALKARTVPWPSMRYIRTSAWPVAWWVK